ncbi:MAG: DNA gyrase inhibitor YacG [Nitrospirae bacterium]|nr:DNA gyrase inhibitor YacG [Nitrospirota bacterium]
MKIKCPVCKQKKEWQGNPYRPFCSERCKLIDLGAWASEEYKIEGRLEDETDMPPSEQERNND